MTAHRGPGVRQLGAVGTTPKEHRLAIAGQYAENSPGVPRSGLLAQGATNVVALTADIGTLAYAVGPLAAVINREIDDGVYTPTATGSNKVTTTAAPASGSRWDLIWCRQNDAEKGDKLPVVGGVADNSFIFGVTQGTSAGTPTRPMGAVPAGALVLAEARIFSGTTSTLQSPNTVTQVFPITASRGAPIPVRNTAERDAITAPLAGMRAIRLDLTGQPLEAFNGTAWLQITGIRHAEYTGPIFTTKAGLGANLGGIGANLDDTGSTQPFTADLAKTVNNAFVQPDTAGRIRILQAGVYNLLAMILPTSVPATYSLRITDITNGGQLASRGGTGYGDRDQSIAAVGAYLPAGTIVEFSVATAASVTMGSRIKITKVQ